MTIKKTTLGRPKIDANGGKVEIGTVTLTESQRATFERMVVILGSRAAVVRYLLEMGANFADFNPASLPPK
jgi:hypothetical protein